MKYVRNNLDKSFLDINESSLNLRCEWQDNNLEINMQTHTLPINTSTLTKTGELLDHIYPKVLKTYCYNSRGLPFCEEVKNTEMGHLFEHILIQQLVDECIKINPGGNFDIEATTSWNWHKMPEGSYHIVVNHIPGGDMKIVSAAIKSSLEIFKLVIHSQITSATSIN